MYCTACGNQMTDTDRYCNRCGKSAGSQGPDTTYGVPRPRLMRSMADKKIAGVCSGLARYLGWDVTIIRVVFLASILLHGFGLLAYALAWICMPRDDLRAYQPPQTA
jgi:phage shock protein C